jgi:hypothetical protein
LLRDGQVELLGPAKDVMQQLSQVAQSPRAATVSVSVREAESERATVPHPATASFGQIVRGKVN